jgi:ATP-binding cassette subfamily B protein
MNYKLRTKEEREEKLTLKDAYRSIKPLLDGENTQLFLAFIAIAVTSAANLLGPYFIARTIDRYIVRRDFHGVLVNSGILFAVFLVALVAQYLQTKLMGGVGRRVLFRLRNAIFTKLQELPVAFFNANKAGDLISRINNDTDKLNQFFSQALMQFVGNFFIMIGAGIFLLTLHLKLGAATLVPAAIVIIITQVLSGWIKRTSTKSLQSLGSMSAEIQESLANFKVVVAFNRLDFFRTKFGEANARNYTSSVRAGIASGTLAPLYTIASTTSLIIVLGYGIVLIGSGNLTLGLLVGFILYVNNFYTPLRQLASLWSTLQLALSSLERISEVLDLETTIKIVPSEKTIASHGVLTFERVSFGYSEDKEILHDVSLTLQKGKTYALVGPTGGGKTTTASLMARLYDPTKGTVYLDGRDIRSYESGERAKKIGFILQEPFLFTGTVGENILYGNDEFGDTTNEQLLGILKKEGIDSLLARFESGLDTKVGASDSISLGQKQLIAFIRAVLRRPELLILDEATANIDTVTEQLLEVILQKLPKETTKVIIAHRLNTIENADDIFFVNGGEVTHAGSFDHAIEMLMHGKRSS